uniref:Uncharacterized protein n=1 Tax=Physcomitrium patens TaxID=3218 RepID=A0A2K1KJ86_PHYPA|nr:hypothetical protein PHYPA_007517 [Physcomitrium patens]
MPISVHKAVHSGPLMGWYQKRIQDVIKNS